MVDILMKASDESQEIGVTENDQINNDNQMHIPINKEVEMENANTREDDKIDTWMNEEVEIKIGNTTKEKEVESEEVENVNKEQTDNL